ncbi:ABC transporter substrate-binding protein [Amorphus sp. 3PC139-8]|uniref:ABC transporter substrate-binding protein n=1 Tax=Amorphus sp. 3PC139-8 TaxID=2735676 RepID=UPI00345D8948
MTIARREFLQLASGAALALAAARPAFAATGKPIKVGSILSVTGPAAFLGEDMKAGLELAIEELNAKGGMAGRPVEWTFYDAESQTQKAISATRRLISQDEVDVIVSGGNMSGIALAMAPLAEAAKVPFVSSEGAMAIVNPVDERKWVFKATVDDSDVLQRIADYCEKKGIKKVAFLSDTSGFGQGAKTQMEIVAPQRGLEVVYESFAPSDTDMMAQLTRIRDSGADAIICWTVTPAGVVFLKQAMQLGLDKRTLIHSYGFVSAKYMELAGAAAEPLLLASLKMPVGDQLPNSDPLKAGILKFYRDYEARFGHPPSLYAAESYDAAMLADQALIKVDADPHRLPEGLESVTGYAGLSGVFNFSPERHSGLSKDDIVLINWRDGRFHLADYA